MDLPARHRHYQALDLVSLPVWIFDIDARRVHWANTAALALWDAPSLEALVTRDLGADMSASVAQRLAQYQADFLARDAIFHEQWTLYPGGRPVSVDVRFTGHRLADGRMAMQCEARGRSVEAPESLRSVEALLHTGVMISLYGRDGRALYRNPAARASVRDPAERLDDRVADPGALADLRESLARGGTATRTLSVRTAQGERWHEFSARRCRDAVTGEDAVLVSEADVSAIKRTEARAQFLALHDPLTGLPNRAHLMQRFEEEVHRLRAGREQAALVFIDLDHFKDVNDTLGHAAGDALLVEIARRLRHAVSGSDLVARLGGDEFLLLLASRDARATVNALRDRLMRAIAEPMDLGGHQVQVTPSLGVSVYPDDGQDIETLLRHADLAMYTAKERGRNALSFYEAGMSDALQRRTVMEAELRQGLARDEFVVHYQPIVDVESGRIVGAEALVRWMHPQHGLTFPDVFVPLCESTGLIRELGARVFEQAARDQARWAAQGHVLRVSVNLSARQLVQPGFLDELRAALGRAGADPRHLQLEITESVLLGRDEALMALLRDIQALGLSIALDDFGTGYSNLAYLQRFPISTLKIDKTFIQSIDANRRVAELIVSMCQLLRLTVVAEGVETHEQLEWVRLQGIDLWQGNLCAQPLPAPALWGLLEQQRPLPWAGPGPEA